MAEVLLQNEKGRYSFVDAEWAKSYLARVGDKKARVVGEKDADYEHGKALATGDPEAAGKHGVRGDKPLQSTGEGLV